MRRWLLESGAVQSDVELYLGEFDDETGAGRIGTGNGEQRLYGGAIPPSSKLGKPIQDQSRAVARDLKPSFVSMNCFGARGKVGRLASLIRKLLMINQLQPNRIDDLQEWGSKSIISQDLRCET
jgi:hypothetical protein